MDPAERLLNLIIALSNARVRMTRAQIRASVAGYEPPLGHAGEEARKREAAFERMFERDKEELRRMGVPLKTVVDSTHGDEIGYKIDAGDAAMPAIDFTASEAAALTLAAEFWGGGALGADALQGLTKIASALTEPAEGELAFGARVTASVDALAVIVEARARRQAVQFDYVSESSGLATRTIEPWQVVMSGPATFLHGFDRDRGEPRTFRLNRIVGAVKAVGPDGSYEIPALNEREKEPPAAIQATVAVRSDAGNALRSRALAVAQEGEWDHLSLEVRSLEGLRNEILALGGRARAIAPESLVESVRGYAEAAASLLPSAGGAS